MKFDNLSLIAAIGYIGVTSSFAPRAFFSPRVVSLSSSLLNVEKSVESKSVNDVDNDVATLENVDLNEILPVYECNTRSSFSTYKEEHAESIADTSKYWGKVANEKLDWFAPFTNVQSGSFEEGDVTWFENGKLNACYNAVDRWCEERGDEVALIWEGDEPSDVQQITFHQLRRKVSQIANALKAQGVKKGDVVTIYMPMTPEVAMTMLACARIGAVHSVIFAGFSSDAIAERIASANSKWIVTSDVGIRGGRTLPLKQICDDAIEKDVCQGVVQKMFVFQHYSNKDGSTDITMDPQRDINFDDLINAQRPYCPCEWMDSEDNLFILYTSGSTGKPKGVLHTTGGYSLYAMHTTQNTFDIKPSDVYACVADAGWITGHTYIVYGPLLNGCSTFMFESTPMYPDNGRYWDMVQRHKISIFYTAPTAIRSLMKFGDKTPKKYDLTSLRILGSVGEPINPEAWRWYYEVIGNKNCALLDTYWQTETGGHIITNLPGITPMKPGSCTLPFYGIDAVVLDAQTGKEIEGNDVEGVIAIKQPWPGITRTCLGDHERYLNVYMKPYPGYYFPGDGCYRDEDGYIWITGRVDDVLNVSGHRIGTAELESALVAHPAVAQAAVIGFPHDIKGQAICCYTTLSEGFEETPELILELRSMVRSSIGPFATPDIICPCPSLPMTRSGKIMRRILRKIASAELDTMGDTSTLSDPSVVDTLIDKMATLRKR